MIYRIHKKFTAFRARSPKVRKSQILVGVDTLGEEDPLIRASTGSTTAGDSWQGVVLREFPTEEMGLSRPNPQALSLRDGTTYQDLGGDYFEQRDLQRILRRSVRRIARLGYRVTLEAA